MSALFQYATPMLDLECLLAALADMGIAKNHIGVHESPVPLGTRFTGEISILGSGVGVLGFRRTPTGYSAVMTSSGRYWLEGLQQAYLKQEQMKRARLEESRKAAEESARTRAELELRRMEEERQRLVQTQKQTVIDKAKKLGYTIQEKQEGETLRLVLVKKVF